MPVGDKPWALNQLRHAKNAYIYTLAAMRLLNSEALLSLRDRRVLIRQDGIIWDPDISDFVGGAVGYEGNQIIAAYQNDNANFQVDLLELYKSSRRNLVKESYETVKKFAAKAGLDATWSKQPWYGFARIIRNAISHDMVISFDAKDLARLPVTLAGTTIDVSMDKKEMTSDLLNPLVTLELIEAMKAFVQAN